MNFFQHQDAARRKTGRLVLLFALAVAAIMAVIYAIVLTIYLANHPKHDATTLRIVDFTAEDYFNPGILLLTVVSVGMVIAAGSLFKIAELSSGGKAIAELLGGRLIDGRSTDWRERRTLNVVEEMAIASGMPTPPVYVLDDETGINAFAAGFTPSDAVIGVTRGTMESLTRDELQGVIAHEFSHIFNGDMRLNIRLMGVLHGILVISLIGYLIFRVALRIRPSRGSSDEKGTGLAIMLGFLGIGAALYVLGYIGVFFGHLIKSAVSRQREYLADASAVQFTRNPQGISGALRKIGAVGSRLASPSAEQASHMYFGNGLKASWLSLMSTHPPLLERIQRIDPQFDGDYSREKLPWPNAAQESAALSSEQGATTPRGATDGILAPAGLSQLAGGSATADVGAPSAKHLAFATRFIQHLPAALTDEIHDPLGAACTIFALLLHADPADDEPMLEYIREQNGMLLADRTRRVLELIQPLSIYSRLPVAQLCMTALRRLTPPQFEQFRKLVVRLVKADRRVSLFEFCLQRMILKHLSRHFSNAAPDEVRYEKLSQVAGPTAVLLSALAHAGQPNQAAAAADAYRAGCAKLGNQIAGAPLSAEACDFGRLDEALNYAACAAGAVKQQILDASAATIARDGKMTPAEAELLRTIADALDSPMPPLNVPVA
jgi:Zn-dependent protease with chaperone function